MVEITLKEEDRGHVRALELFCIREYLEGPMTKAGTSYPRTSSTNWGHPPRFLRPLPEERAELRRQGRGPIVGFVFGQMVDYIDNIAKVVWVENIGVHPTTGGRASATSCSRGRPPRARRGGQGRAEHHHPGPAASVLLHKKMGFFLDGRKIAFLDLESFQ